MTFFEKIFVESPPNIVANFRRSYKVALGLTALLLLILAILAQWALSDQKEDATFINMAGRQRMLSQQITKRVLLFQGDPKGYGPKLKSSLEQFHDAHSTLNSRSMSDEARQKFEALEHSKMELTNSVEVYLLAPGRGNLAAILDSETEFLKQMEICVEALETCLLYTSDAADE